MRERRDEYIDRFSVDLCRITNMMARMPIRATAGPASRYGDIGADYR
jgi:hypothetical protein